MPYRDLERRRAYGREWMRKNPDKAREGMRRWRARHPEIKKARARAYYEDHRDKIIAKVASYFRQHPEIALALRNNRRSRELNAEGAFTRIEWLELVAQYGGRCAYCGAAEMLVPDHRVPLSRGGSNWIKNILPACPRCNQKKYVATENEFRRRLEQERQANGGSS